MRLALLSDIHGNLPALEAVVRDLARHGVDAVVNLGDTVSGPLLPRETAQFLMAQDWIHLAGNHERQLLTLPPEGLGPSDAYAHSQLTAAEWAWLASLPATHDFEGLAFCCHGTPGCDTTYGLETVEPGHVRLAHPKEIEARFGGIEGELVACGHTHVPRTVHASSGALIVNPGSVGVQAYHDSCPHPHVMQTGSPDSRYALVERRGEAWVSMHLTVPYNSRPMAQLARDRRRPDWAQALETGCLPPERSRVSP